MHSTDSALSLIFALKVALYCKEISSQSTNKVCAIENPLYFHIKKLYWLFTFCLLAKPTSWQNGQVIVYAIKKNSINIERLHNLDALKTKESLDFYSAKNVCF